MLSNRTRIGSYFARDPKLCKQDKYDVLWKQLYSMLGIYISAGQEVKIAFHDTSNVCTFDLLKGAYLFYSSQTIRKLAEEDFSVGEIFLLRSAIAYNSTHATQRYNSYLYSKIERGRLAGDESTKSLLMEAINNCKKMLELSGSYAYMMLAEAYFHFAQWAIEENEVDLARSAAKSAITACEAAKTHLARSEYSIQNASLGQGLARSNSFGIQSPDEAKILVQNWMDEQLSNTTVYQLGV